MQGLLLLPGREEKTGYIRIEWINVESDVDQMIEKLKANQFDYLLVEGNTFEV